MFVFLIHFQDGSVLLIIEYMRKFYFIIEMVIIFSILKNREQTVIHF